MREEVRKFHLEVMAQHAHNMFMTLIHEHNIMSKTLKTIEFEDSNGLPLDNKKGYFAVKDKKMYWIDEKFHSQLPIRLGSDNEELKHKDNMVFRPLNPQPLRIVPKNIWDIREFVDNYMPFEHSNPEHWLLLKFICLMGYIGRSYVCVASNSEFGKSSLFEALHYITDKNPVFKPRSVPGVLSHINGVGNIVFDETHRCKKEVRDVIEEFGLQIAGGKAYYINGAMKSHGTESKYSCLNQSIMFLYNNIDSYKNQKEDYFDYILSNNKAIDTRFIKVKLDGKLMEKFDKDFDIPAEAASNKQYYINVIKQLLYLQELKRNNGYARRYVTNSKLGMKGRHGIVYAEITWLMDMYCDTQAEMDRYIAVFDGTIQAYKDMI